MKKSIVILNAILIGIVLLGASCKKEKKTEPTPNGGGGTGNTEKKYTLVIENGAFSAEIGKSISLSAHLVNANGVVVSPGSVSWSSNLGGVSGNVFSVNTETVGTVSASVQHEGVTYSTSVPVNVLPLKTTMVFAVAPSAIIWGLGHGGIQLETVYLGGTANFSFASENASIASVSSSGMVSFHALGSTKITVSATINGEPHTYDIPVLVVGEPEVTAPVTRISLSPSVAELFRGETVQLTAKAFNKNGDDVTSSVNFVYTIVPKEEEGTEPGDPINLTSGGLVTAKAIGSAYVKITGAGLVAQSEIIVNPDTIIMVNPFHADLGGIDPFTFQPNPDNKTFTATTYKVDRAAYKLGSSNFLSTIPNPSNLTWELPNTGIPEIDNMFNVVTLSEITNSSAKVTKIAGKAGGTFIVAHAGYYGGGAGITVMP